MKRAFVAATVLTLAVLAPLAAAVRAESMLQKMSDELVATAKKVSPSVVELRFEAPAAQTTVQRLGENGAQVRIRLQVTAGASEPFRGSGIVMTRDGYILTAAEHLRGRGDAKITATFDRGRSLEAKVVGRDVRSGLALLKVDAQDLTPVTLADALPPVGSFVVAAGDTAGLGKSVSLGIVSATRRAVAGNAGVGNATQFPDLLQITNPVTPNDVGGLVADLDGRMVGVLHSSMTGRPVVAQPMDNAGGTPAQGGGVRVVGLGPGGPPQMQGVSFATPVATVRRVFEALRNGRSPWGYLGLYFSMEKDKGLKVTQVVPQSPGAAAGIRPGDVVTLLSVPGVEPLKLAGDEKEAAAFSQAVGEAGPDTEVVLGITRDGQPQNVTARLGALPDMPEQNVLVFDNFRVEARTQPAEQFMRHPWLGAELQASPAGATIAALAPNSPAERHGLKGGDVITKVSDVEVKTPEEVAREIEKHKPGEFVRISFRRDKVDGVVAVALGLQPGPAGVDANDLRAVLGRQTWLGIEARNTEQGLLVTRVIEGSPAEKAGIKLNDIVVRADDKPIQRLVELRDFVRGRKPADIFALVVRRNGNEIAVKGEFGSLGDSTGNVAP